MEGKGWRYDGKYLKVFGTVPVSHREKYPAGTAQYLYMLDRGVAIVYFFTNKKGIEMWRAEYKRSDMSKYDVFERIRLIHTAIATTWK